MCVYNRNIYIMFPFLLIEQGLYATKPASQLL